MKVCPMCGAQNDDVFTKCATCGADLTSVNGDDEKTVLLDPEESQAVQTGAPTGFSVQTDANAYGQQGAQQYNAQPGFDASQSYGQAGMSQQYNTQPGFDTSQPYNMQAAYGAPAQQPKAKKGMLIGILAGAVVLVAVALLLIFKVGIFGGKGGTKSPEAVAKVFVEAMNEKDAEKLSTLCPPFLDAGQEDLQQMIDMYSSFDVTFTYEGVNSQDDYDSDELKDLQEDVSDYAEKSIKLQAACDLNFSFNTAMSMLGETYDESSDYTITCIKYKGNWYLYE